MKRSIYYQLLVLSSRKRGSRLTFSFDSLNIEPTLGTLTSEHSRCFFGDPKRWKKAKLTFCLKFVNCKLSVVPGPSIPPQSRTFGRRRDRWSPNCRSAQTMAPKCHVPFSPKSQKSGRPPPCAWRLLPTWPNLEHIAYCLALKALHRAV